MAKTNKKKIPVRKAISEEVMPPKENVRVEKKPEVKVEAPKKETPQKVKRSVESLPAALLSEAALDIVTAKAAKTTVKYCGRWFKLVQGKPVTASASQIAYLRSCGLVE